MLKSPDQLIADPASGSLKLFDRANQFIPGGVNSPVRAFRAVGQTPRFIARALGSHIWDVDDIERIDFVGSWGPLILGHAQPAVVAAVQQAAVNGLTYGAPTEGEIQLAETICELVPSIEKVRLVSSGTEAVMTAIRLARAFTGRDLIVKMNGCYHGHSDGMLIQAGSGLMTSGIPDSAGVPTEYAGLTVSCPYNDITKLQNLFAAAGPRIAAVILEPVAANMGVVPPLPGYLQQVRHLTETAGSLLIFDEVITGFRLALGGAQQLFNIHPDLTTLGKIIGGGLPMGAVGGRAAIMNQLAPLGPVYQAGTLSGNPLSVAAGLATLRLLMANPGIYERLNRQAEELAATLELAARTYQIPLTVNRCGSLFSAFFTSGPVQNDEQAKQSNVRNYTILFDQMIRRGIYLPPSMFEAWFLSAAHQDEDLQHTARAICYSFAASAAQMTGPERLSGGKNQ